MPFMEIKDLGFMFTVPHIDQ